MMKELAEDSKMALTFLPNRLQKMFLLPKHHRGLEWPHRGCSFCTHPSFFPGPPVQTLLRLGLCSTGKVELCITRAVLVGVWPPVTAMVAGLADVKSWWDTVYLWVFCPVVVVVMRTPLYNDVIFKYEGGRLLEDQPLTASIDGSIMTQQTSTFFLI